MPRITIDQREVELPPGATILDGARRLGIEIPTLCYLEGRTPLTTCLVCMVKVRETDRFVPACATEAVDGMHVESETEEVHAMRRAALELLVSDHVGDCVAPCQFACPAGMDIPKMLRQIAAGANDEAIRTIKRDIALPAVLGRICPKPCEKVCRRGKADGAVAICDLKRFAADVDLARETPYLPECRSSSGRRVAILGAGPSGLAAAYYLLQAGHAVAVMDERPVAGGRLWEAVEAGRLPAEVLQAEIRTIERIGAEMRLGNAVDCSEALKELQNAFDAVVLACGNRGSQMTEPWGLGKTKRGIEVDKATFQTSQSGVFAIGLAVRGTGMVVRSVADGKEVAVVVDSYLHGKTLQSPEKPFSTKIGRMSPEETARLMANAVEAARSEADDRNPFGFPEEEAIRQASRCLHCDCVDQEGCLLRRYAARYGARVNRYRAERREFRRVGKSSGVIYEPGKCIRCGRCIEVASSEGARPGLALIGRGFDVEVGVPFDQALEEALGKAAAQCVAVCPTAALWMESEQ